MGDIGRKQAKLYGSLALCVPAQRMAVVQAWAWHVGGDEWDVGHEVFPVVAIRSAVVLDFAGRREYAGDSSGRMPTPALMEKHGWTFQGSYIDEQCLVFETSEHGNVVPEELLRDSSNAKHEVFLYAGDAEAAAGRLARLAAKLEAEVLRDEKRKLAARAAESKP